MKKEQIYQLLNARGINATMIARSLGVTAPAVQKVIIDGYGSERVARAVANMCDKELFEMFPYYQKKHEEQQAREATQKRLDEKLARFA